MFDALKNLGNLPALMQKAREMQDRMKSVQDELARRTVEADAGGGMVSATVDGKGEVKEIRLDPACVDKNDVEMLEDLIVAAVSQAQAKARQVYEEEMKKAAGGLPMQIPGLF